jgi:hypothetical protein
MIKKLKKIIIIYQCPVINWSNDISRIERYLLSI